MVCIFAIVTSVELGVPQKGLRQNRMADAIGLNPWNLNLVNTGVGNAPTVQPAVHSCLRSVPEDEA